MSNLPETCSIKHEDIDKMTVVELKSTLQERSLSTSGKKVDLVERLKNSVTEFVSENISLDANENEILGDDDSINSNDKVTANSSSEIKSTSQELKEKMEKGKNNVTAEAISSSDNHENISFEQGKSADVLSTQDDIVEISCMGEDEESNISPEKCEEVTSSNPKDECEMEEEKDSTSTKYDKDTKTDVNAYLDNSLITSNIKESEIHDDDVCDDKAKQTDSPTKPETEDGVIDVFVESHEYETEDDKEKLGEEKSTNLDEVETHFKEDDCADKRKSVSPDNDAQEEGEIEKESKSSKLDKSKTSSPKKKDSSDLKASKSSLAPKSTTIQDAHSYRRDVRRRTIVVRHLSEKLPLEVKDFLKSSDQFQLRYTSVSTLVSNDNSDNAPGEILEEEKEGNLEIRFKTVDNAKAAIAFFKSIKGYKDKSLDVSHHISELNEAKDLNSIYIGNLPTSATKDMLAVIFKEAKNIEMPLDNTNKPKGHAYLEFENKEEAEKALKNYAGVSIDDGEATRQLKLLSVVESKNLVDPNAENGVRNKRTSSKSSGTEEESSKRTSKSKNGRSSSHKKSTKASSPTTHKSYKSYNSSNSQRRYPSTNTSYKKSAFNYTPEHHRSHNDSRIAASKTFDSRQRNAIYQQRTQGARSFHPYDEFHHSNASFNSPAGGANITSSVINQALVNSRSASTPQAAAMNLIMGVSQLLNQQQAAVASNNANYSGNRHSAVSPTNPYTGADVRSGKRNYESYYTNPRNKFTRKDYSTYDTRKYQR